MRMQTDSKIFVAGHRGMVGSAMVRTLQKAGFHNLVLRTSAELNLTNQDDVAAFFAQEKPEFVFLAAARVGGIVANNTFRGEFLYDNLMIQNNVVHQSYLNGVKKLLFFGSSCIYPKLAEQPLREESLLTGLLEHTNEPYAIAKIAGIKLCEAYRDQYGCNYVSVMPTNLYGYNDNYHPEHSHVLPALIRKFHEAKVNGAPSVEIWGSGNPRREFLFVDDLAEAALLVMQSYDDRGFLNIGSGEDQTIRELAEIIAEVMEYNGSLTFDTSRPDGTPRKLMEVSKIKALGWQPKTALKEGIKLAYLDFLSRQ